MSQARRTRWYRPRRGGSAPLVTPGEPPARSPADAPPAIAKDVYHHFTAGLELLEGGHPAQAAIRLEKARNGAPEKTSIREALGRAYFAVGRWQDAEDEFRRVVDVAPTNAYAHYGLGRSLQRQGRQEESRTHLKLARAMRAGDEQDYGSGLTIL